NLVLPVLPDIQDDGVEQTHVLGLGSKRPEKFNKMTFESSLGHFHAPALPAMVVGVFLCLPSRPAARERSRAMRAGHESPQRKVPAISNMASKRHALAVEKQLNPSED